MKTTGAKKQMATGNCRIRGEHPFRHNNSSNMLDYISRTLTDFNTCFVHPEDPEYSDSVRAWNIMGSFPNEVEFFVECSLQGAYSQGYQDGATRLQKDTIKEILSEVIKNGSADRTSIITELTKKYKKLTGIDIPKITNESRMCKCGNTTLPESKFCKDCI